MSSDLHLTFLVTPVTEELRINWARFDALFGRLPEVERRIAGLVGVVSGEGAAVECTGGGIGTGINAEGTVTYGKGPMPHCLMLLTVPTRLFA